MASGKETREYRNILEHMGTICEHLRVNSRAKELLTIKYEERGWIDISESPDERTLVQIVLNRISNDVSQYHIFIKMLKAIKGMDIIVNKIEGMVALYINHPHSCIILFVPSHLQ